MEFRYVVRLTISVLSGGGPGTFAPRLESCIGSGFKTRHVRHCAQQLQQSSRVVDSVCVTDTHTEQTIRDGY
jgi:hypothetical protein